MPKTQKTTAKNSSITAEQALHDITADQSWSKFKSNVVSAACKLYQSGELQSAADLALLLDPLNNEIKEALALATGVYAADPKEKLLTLMLEGHNLKEALAIVKQMGNLKLSQQDAYNIILAHQEEFQEWSEAPLSSYYYPIIFLHQYSISLIDESYSPKVKSSYLDLAVGIDNNGYRELIAFRIHPLSPSSEAPFHNLLRQLQSRKLPAPLLLGGPYESNDFHQEYLEFIYPQTYYIPNRKDTLAKMKQRFIPRSWQVVFSTSTKSELQQAINGAYHSKSLAEFNHCFAQIDMYDQDYAHDLYPLCDVLCDVFCPEVRQALVSLPPALRKLLCETPPVCGLGKEGPLKSIDGVYDAKLINIITHQYYLQVVRKEWQRRVSNWPQVYSDLETFVQRMHEAKAPVAPMVKPAQN